MTNYPVCAFFDSRDDAYAVLTPFYREGLEWGEKAVHIVDPALRQDHKHRLREAGIEGDRTVELLRAAGSEITEPSSPWWNIVKTFDTASPSAAHIDSPAGRLRVAYVPLGYRGGDGGVLLGSLQQDFPTVTDSVTLRPAASVADSAVQTARLLDEKMSS